MFRLDLHKLGILFANVTITQFILFRLFLFVFFFCLVYNILLYDFLYIFFLRLVFLGGGWGMVCWDSNDWVRFTGNNCFWGEGKVNVCIQLSIKYYFYVIGSNILFLFPSISIRIFCHLLCRNVNHRNNQKEWNDCCVSDSSEQRQNLFYIYTIHLSNMCVCQFQFNDSFEFVLDNLKSCVFGIKADHRTNSLRFCHADYTDYIFMLIGRAI